MDNIKSIGGSGNSGGGQYIFNGNINAVSIFNYALSSSQITTLWGGGTSVSNPMALSSPPIAYYPLGTSAWNGNFLAENNAIGDYVFDFDGTSYVETSSILKNASQATFNIWVNFDDTSTSSIFGKGTGNDFFSFYTWTNGVLYFWMKDNGVAGEASVNPFKQGSSIVNINQWNMLTVVFDGTQTGNDRLKIYLNGGSNNIITGYTGTIPATLTNTNDNFWIGKFTSSQVTNSKLSNFQAFNTALSSTEIETLYNYGSPIRTLANIPQNSNLKAWYKLDASEVYNNTTTEWSIDNNQNPSAYASSLDFDSASSDYIDCGNNSNLYPQTGDMSYSFWVNPDVLSGLQTIYGRTGMSTGTKGVNINLSGSEVRVFMGVGVSGQWGVNTGGGTGGGALITSNSGLTVGQWSHVVLTLDRDGDGVIYINGVPVVTAAMNPNDYSSVDIVDSRSNLIGNGNAYSNVKISNMSVWNTALTSSQVTEIYNNGTPSNLSSHSATSNLVSWWKLNNTTIGVEDAKGSNNGTNNGATEYPGFVNRLAGDSSGMSQANLVQSDLQTVAPYSKYAMSFDAASSDYIQTTFNPYTSIGDNTSWTVSSWVYVSNVTTEQKILGIYDTTRAARFWIGITNGGILFGYGNRGVYPISGTSVSANSWQNIIVTYNTTTEIISAYVNGSINGTYDYAGNSGNGIIANANITIGDAIGESTFVNGYISNVSIWNAALTSIQISEIYNEGLPSNLNSHSAYSNLVAWWQLGENSSFTNNWIVADEKGTNNGEGQNMGVDALTNGVGTTANGVSSGMAVGALVGDAPYSTANAISSGMSVESRVTGSGNTP